MNPTIQSCSEIFKLNLETMNMYGHIISLKEKKRKPIKHHISTGLTYKHSFKNVLSLD